MAHSAAQVSLRKTGALPSGPAFSIMFRRKLWISRRVPHSDMVLAVVFHQLLEDLMDNNLVSAREAEPTALPLIAKLAALQVLARPKVDKALLSTYVCLAVRQGRTGALMYRARGDGAVAQRRLFPLGGAVCGVSAAGPGHVAHQYHAVLQADRRD
jgi:hypothetical protein